MTPTIMVVPEMAGDVRLMMEVLVTVTSKHIKQKKFVKRPPGYNQSTTLPWRLVP